MAQQEPIGAAGRRNPPARGGGRRLGALAGVLVLAVAAVAALLALRPSGSAKDASHTAPARPATPSPVASAGGSGAPAAPTDGALVGAWVKPLTGGAGQVGQSNAPGTGALGAKDVELPSTVSAYQKLAGRRLDIVHVYRKWQEPFPGAVERFAVSQGSAPMISWGGTDSAAILSGRYDSLVRQRAEALKKLGAPVFLRWFWEMDRPDKQYVTGSPEDFVAAWRHLRSIFASERVTNVSWVWCPTAISFSRGYGPRYYPGDDAVDWTCADGYSGGSQSGKAVRSFGQVFQPFYDWAVQHPRPIMIGEFGVQKGAGDQAGWLREAAATLQRDFPKIKAVVYFDAVRPGANGQSLSWSLRESPTAMAQWRAILREPYFNPRKVPAGAG